MKYTEDDIVRMLDYLIDNIFVVFGGQIFRQTIGIPMGTNCAPLLADLYLYSYEAEFIQDLLKKGQKQEAKSFNFTFRYINDVLSISNPNFEKYIPFIYPAELEVKNMNSVSYLDIRLELDSKKLYTFLLCLEDRFSNRQLVYLWVQIVPHYLLFCIYIHMRRSIYNIFYRRDLKRGNPLILPSDT